MSFFIFFLNFTILQTLEVSEVLNRFTTIKVSLSSKVKTQRSMAKSKGPNHFKIFSFSKVQVFYQFETFLKSHNFFTIFLSLLKVEIVSDSPKGF